MRPLSPQAMEVLESQYLLKDSLKRVVETPRDLFHRIAKAVAKVESQWSSLDEVDYYESEYYRMMNQLEFLPNAATLLNAGKPNAQLVSSYVFSVPDNIDGIAKSVKSALQVQQQGGEVGFSFSNLRPKEDPVQSGQSASGPVEFLKHFDAAIGKHQAATCAPTLAVLKIDHPDIFEFIEAKEKQIVQHLSLAVGVTSHFMRCLKKGTTYPLVNPRNQKMVVFVPARKIFEAICQSAWKSGSPGLLFVDEMNRYNPTPHLGKIEAATAWGEQPLLADESCGLGSLNLAMLIKNREFDEERFEIIIDLAVRFLDNLVEMNHYPNPEVEKLSRANRKIGLGIFGFADMLEKLEIPYESSKARTYAGALMKLFIKRCRQASAALGEQRGSFKNFKGSALEKLRFKFLRNATVTTVATSDVLSRIAGAMDAIEPPYFLVREGKDRERRAYEFAATFRGKLEEYGLPAATLFEQIIQEKSFQNVDSIAKKLRDTFKTHAEIEWLDHIKMQAAFQKHVDNGVVKAIYLRADATREDVYKIYMSAYDMKCKSVFVQRFSERDAKQASSLFIAERGAGTESREKNFYSSLKDAHQHHVSL